MATPKLSPCPFCGGEAKLYEFHEIPSVGEAYTKYNPGCATNGCPIEGWIEVWFKTKEEAAAIWNSRALPLDAIKAARDALKDIIVQGGRGVMRKERIKENLQNLAELDKWLQSMEPSK